MPTSRSTRKTTATPKNSQSKAAKKGVSSASAWKKNKPVELELPSGEVCLARRPGIESLLADNVFGDNVLPMIQKSINAGKGGKPAELDEDEILKNPSLITDVMSSFDRVTVKVVVEPKVAYHRRQVNGTWEEIPHSERDDEIVYTDEVDMADKMFLFQWATGGSADLAKFREQSGPRLAALADGEGV